MRIILRILAVVAIIFAIQLISEGEGAALIGYKLVMVGICVFIGSFVKFENVE